MKRNRKVKEHFFTHFSFVFRSVGFTSTNRYTFQFWMWSVSKKKRVSIEEADCMNRTRFFTYGSRSQTPPFCALLNRQSAFGSFFFSHTQQLKKKERKKLAISTSNQSRNLVPILLLSFFFYSLKWVSATLPYPHLSGESRPQLFFSPNSCEYVSQISKTRVF